MKRRQVSDSRKGLYYVGIVLTITGFVLFLVPFFTAFSNDRVGPPAGMFRYGIVGFVLILVGNTLRRIGARGLAGSGLILDPEQAREDLEPWARMGGGMVKDALDEADIDLGGRRDEVVKVRCRSCKTLNDEDAKFCDECGEPL